MSGLTLHIGAPDEATAPNSNSGFAPPPKAGIARMTCRTVQINDKLKNYPQAEQIRLGFSTKELIDGTANEGWVEFFFFNVPPEKEKEEPYTKLKVDIQKGKMRNWLMQGLGLAASIKANVDDRGGKKAAVLPEKWKGREVIAEFYLKEEEYNGTKKQVAQVTKFFTEEEIKELTGKAGSGAESKKKDSKKDSKKEEEAPPASLPDDDIPLD